MAIDGNLSRCKNKQWKALAEQIADESDPIKILTLTRQLIELLDLVSSPEIQNANWNSVVVCVFSE